MQFGSIICEMYGFLQETINKGTNQGKEELTAEESVFKIE